MTAVSKRTNAEVIEPVVSKASAALKKAGQWAVDHPDEVVLLIAPALVVSVATHRHDLSLIEFMLLWELGYYSGILGLKAYRDWKSQPAGTALRVV